MVPACKDPRGQSLGGLEHASAVRGSARVCSAGLEPRGGERPRRLAEEVAGCGALSLTGPRGVHNL